MRKILVVGGAGYVGSVLVNELIASGYDVRVFDRLYFGTSGIDGIKDRIELKIGDMRLISSDVFENVDAVINIGGISNDPTAEYNPEANFEMNTTASIKLAELCKKYGIRRYIYASSCSIYDEGDAGDEKDVIRQEDAVVSPKAAYALSKYEAEKGILALADANFCPVILRKGTVYGFSQRMRYDLVVNTFVKDALSHGRITIFSGGAMWRPLIDVRDAARAYICCLCADEDAVRGQIFNVSYKNFRISELAYRVRDVLLSMKIPCEINVDYGYSGVRSYRVSTKKIERALDFRPSITVEESVKDIVEKVRKYNYLDFDNPIYYNIKWFKLLESAKNIIDITGSVFSAKKTP